MPRPVRPHLPAAAGYLVLTMAVLWPAVRHFRSQPLVNGTDSAVFMWAWWSMPRALDDGANPFPTDSIFHPVGADLALTTTTPLVSALTWPVRAALGPAAQVNTVQLVSMFFAGLAAYLLAWLICRHRGASFVAGLAFALLPLRFVHVQSHLNLVETAVLPFGLLVFLWFSNGPSVWRSIALGLTCGSIFLIDPQLAMFVGVCLVTIAVVRRRSLAPSFHHLAAAGAVAVLVAAPLLVPMTLALESGEGTGRAEFDAELYSSVPLAWLVPPLDQLAIGELTGWEPDIAPTSEGVAYPGFAMLVLAVAGAGNDAWRRRGWVAMALVGASLSFGPLLIVGSRYVDPPMPFDLLGLLPGVEMLRAPGRFAFVGALAICMLAAVTLAGVARRWPRWAGWSILAAGAVTMIELLPGPLPDVSHEVPEAYRSIAQDEGDGAVLEVPIKWSTGSRLIGFKGFAEDFLFMYYATVHERPIVSGSVSRYPDDRLDALLQIPLYRQVLALGGEPGFDERAEFEVADLQRLGIGYVVYDREDPAPRAFAYLRSLDLPVLVDDGRVIVWKVTG